jgi:hypothetical protein
LNAKTMGHGFSIEMNSKRHVKNISITDERRDSVLFEGYLGELERLSMIEGLALEVRGTNGTLRVDLSEEELRTILSTQDSS